MTQQHYRGYTLTTEPHPQYRPGNVWEVRPEDIGGGWRLVLTDVPLRPLEVVTAEVDALLASEGLTCR